MGTASGSTCPGSTCASGLLSCLMVSASLPVPSLTANSVTSCTPWAASRSVSFWPQGMGLACLRLVSEPLNQLSPVVPACTGPLIRKPRPRLRKPHPLPQQPRCGSQDGLGGPWVSAQDCEACGSETLSPGHGRRPGWPAQWTGPLIAYLWKERLEVPLFYRCPQTRML